MIAVTKTFQQRTWLRFRIRPRLLALCFCLIAARARLGATQLNLGNNTGTPGSIVSLASSLSGDTNTVAIQYDVVFNSTNLSSTAALDADAAGSHLLSSALINQSTRRVLLYSPINARLTNGVLANLIFSIATNAPLGVSSLTLTNAIFANPLGNRVQPSSLAPGSITVSLSGAARFGSILLSTNGVVQFHILGTSNNSYVIQASTNLTQWLDLSTNVATGGTIDFIDSQGSQFPYRFYRIKSSQ